MTMGLVGKKCGMTRIFSEEGISVPVTVLEMLPNRVTQLKTLEKDGYTAIQLTTGTRKRSRLTRSIAGHYSSVGVEPGEKLFEFRVDLIPNEIKSGSEITASIFVVGDFVDVTAVSKGKGYAGVIKRHNFSSQDATHGNSLSHRAPGSIGQRQSPGRVFKGKKMSGHMGNVSCTIQSQPVIRIDTQRNLMMIRGAIPGAIGTSVIVKPAVKYARKTKDAGGKS